MSPAPEPEKPKKAPRKHVTTACVPCRESKIRVRTSSCGDRRQNLICCSATARRHTVKIVSEREKIANTSMGMTRGSKLGSLAFDACMGSVAGVGNCITDIWREDETHVRLTRIPEYPSELPRSCSLRELTSSFNSFMSRD